MHGKIISGRETRALIERELETSHDLLLLSAYFTLPGFSWLSKYSNVRKVQLVLRGTPLDFQSGASSISAVRLALGSGWQVRVISALHAKAYVIGDSIFIGSGNLTSNGMSLAGAANLELNTVVAKTKENIAVIRNVFDQGQEVSLNELNAMEEYIQASATTRNVVPPWWPSVVLPQVFRKLFCNDFPAFRFDSTPMVRGEYWSDFLLLVEQSHIAEATEFLQYSHAYNWLKCELMQSSVALSFGNLSAKLHHALSDDPAPYRSTVKELLANLLSFLERFEAGEILVSRPGYSQIVSYRGK